jgi:biotin-(acetyl-CoA carboxylase) ligase
MPGSDAAAEPAETAVALPPLLNGHACHPPADPFAEACRSAMAGALGAGDVIWSTDQAAARIALVLEPDVSAGIAQQMLPLMAVAVGDCLGALLPPQVAVEFIWPNVVLVNGAVAARIRYDAAARSVASAPPDWLVIAADIRLRNLPGAAEPGHDVHSTSLAEEGGEELTSARILSSLSAHVLAWLDIWQDRGFDPLHAQWLFRARGRTEPMIIEHDGSGLSGTILGLTPSGGLRIAPAPGRERILDLDLDALRSEPPL